MKDSTKAPRPPGKYLAITEVPRAATEVLSLVFKYRKLLQAPKGNGRPVVTLPGYLTGDGSTAVLRRYLSEIGYDARPWQLGRNIQDRRIKSVDCAIQYKRDMIDRVAERIQRVYEETGRKVALVGWSLGGIYADNVAFNHPYLVDQVITLGSPFGDMRGVALYELLRPLIARHIKPREPDFKRWSQDIPQGARPVPTTVLYSPKDGIVSSELATLSKHHSVKHKSVDASHIGYTLNPKVFWEIAHTLAERNTGNLDP